MATNPGTLPDDLAALKAIIMAQQVEIARLSTSERAYDALIQSLKIRIARLQK
ncbi:hypothetical protein EDC31_12933, partial [Acidomonas methanolica]